MAIYREFLLQEVKRRGFSVDVEEQTKEPSEEEQSDASRERDGSDEASSVGGDESIN